MATTAIERQVPRPAEASGIRHRVPFVEIDLEARPGARFDHGCVGLLLHLVVLGSQTLIRPWFQSV